MEANVSRSLYNITRVEFSPLNTDHAPPPPPPIHPPPPHPQKKKKKKRKEKVSMILHIPAVHGSVPNVFQVSVFS